MVEHQNLRCRLFLTKTVALQFGGNMKDCTDITIILDKSGSMASVATDTIGGFNTFLQAQRACKATIRLSLIQFNEVYRVDYINEDIKEAKELTDYTYRPEGYTALYDAIGRTIDSIGHRLNLLPEHLRPNKVVVVVMTDGFENYSREFSGKKISSMIAHQKEKYNWEFVFMGANQDAILTGKSISIAPTHSMTFDHSGAGVLRAYQSLSDNVQAYACNTAASLSFTPKDREAQDELLNIKTSTYTIKSTGSHENK